MKLCMDGKNNLLIDSSVLIALFYPEDSQHKKAEAIYHKLLKYKRYFTLHPLVFLETLTVLKKRVDRTSLLLSEKILCNSEIFIHVEDNLNSYQLIVAKSVTIEIFNNQNDLSFIDSRLIEYCLKNELDLLTFDKNLEKIYKSLL